MQLKEHSSSESTLKGLSLLRMATATATAREWGFKYRRATRGQQKRGGGLLVWYGGGLPTGIRVRHHLNGTNKQTSLHCGAPLSLIANQSNT